MDSAVKEIESAKAKEVVLTGINLSAYGKDIGSSLVELIKRIKNVDKRISLGSLEVGIVTEEFLSALSELKDFCPHFHLSLQSGSDKILKKMNRKYTREEYLSAVRLIERYFDRPSITTDVIVGFPGEEEEDFLDTLDLCKKSSFSDVHVFPYSKREGTVAYKYGELNGLIVKDRVERLEKVRDELKSAYLEKSLGKKTKVLIEEEIDGEKVGYGERYVRVYVDSDKKSGDIVEITPVKLYKDGLKA